MTQELRTHVLEEVKEIIHDKVVLNRIEELLVDADDTETAEQIIRRAVAERRSEVVQTAQEFDLMRCRT